MKKIFFLLAMFFTISAFSQSSGSFSGPQLPRQTGHAGKYLKTNGVKANWESVTAGVSASLTAGYMPVAVSSSSLANSPIYSNSVSVVIGSTSFIGDYGLQSQTNNSYLFGNNNTSTYGEIRFGLAGLHKTTYLENGAIAGSIDYLNSRKDEYFDMFRFLNKSGSELVRVLSTGDFGINGIPTARFHVKASSASSLDYLFKFENSTLSRQLILNNDGLLSNTGRYYGVWANNESFSIFSLNGSSGNIIDVTAGGTPVIQLSVPTSSAGLPSRALWNDAGTLKIVP